MFAGTRLIVLSLTLAFVTPIGAALPPPPDCVGPAPDAPSCVSSLAPCDPSGGVADCVPPGVVPDAPCDTADPPSCVPVDVPAACQPATLVTTLPDCLAALHVPPPGTLPDECAALPAGLQACVLSIVNGRLPPGTVPDECSLATPTTNDLAACLAALGAPSAPDVPAACTGQPSAQNATACTSGLGAPSAPEVPAACTAPPSAQNATACAVGLGAPTPPQVPDTQTITSLAPTGGLQTLGEPPAGQKVLHIDAPANGGFVGRSVAINFTTNLQSNGSATPGFDAFYALAGTGTFTWIGHTPCLGNASVSRSCTIAWSAPADGQYTLRVDYGNATCATSQCAAVTTTVDGVKPTTMHDEAQALASYYLAGPLQLNFTTERGANVTLAYTIDGGATRTLAGWAIADAAGNATFNLTLATPGTYRYYANATDRAGNQELAHASPDVTLQVISSLSMTVGSSSLYFKNGDASTIVQTCVKRGPTSVTAGTVSGKLNGGAPVAFTHVSGCVWQHDFGAAPAVASLTKQTLQINATNGTGPDALNGAFSGVVTFTPARLVALAVVSANTDAWVPAPGTATVEIAAKYNDTGEPADTMDITATGGASPITVTTDGDGIADFYIDGSSVSEVLYTFTASTGSQDGLQIPVTPISAQQDVVWTALVASYKTGTNFANNTDVGYEFVVTYELTWAHSPGLPARGASLTLLSEDDANDASFSAGADANGLATAIVWNSTIVAKRFDVVAVDDMFPQFFQTATGIVQPVNFTRIYAAVTTNSTLANVGNVFDFRINASYLHDASDVAAGARFTVLAGGDIARPIDNVTLGPDGVAYAHHNFTGDFNENVSVMLSSASQGVSGQVLPRASVPKIESTELVFTAIGVNDNDVEPSTTVHFSTTAKYAHNNSNFVNATLTLTPTAGGSAVTCNMVSGVASCDVTRTDVVSTDFVLTALTTDTAIYVIKGGSPHTPVVNWTLVDLSLAAPDDTIVDVGATITLPVTAVFDHDHAQAVSGATIVAKDASASTLGTCTTDPAGRCSLSLVSASVYSGAVSLAVTSSPTGVTTLAAPASTGTLTWTKLIVSYTLDTGPFNIKKGANYHVSVEYAHAPGTPVPNALVTLAGFSTGSQSNYTDANGQTILSAIESTAGTRDITITARLPTEGVAANDTASGSPRTASERWTAIGFRAYTFSPAPSSFDANGEPQWPVNTAVTACTIAVAADTNTTLSGASVTMRGISKTTDSGGNACITIARSTQVRDVTLTSHGVSSTIGGSTITASIDLRTVMHFVSS